MSPTVFQHNEYRFYFFSREESRPHIHVYSPEGEAKFWLEPTVSLANVYGFKLKQINEIQRIVEEKQDEIKRSWQKHFSR
jgi:hypothetical protein